MRIGVVLLAACAFSFETALAQVQQPTRQAQSSEVRVSGTRGFIPPADVNVHVGTDPRTSIVMAAINIAGFEYEPGGQPLTPARAKLRKDLAGLDPAVKQRLTEF